MPQLPVLNLPLLGRAYGAVGAEERRRQLRKEAQEDYKLQLDAQAKAFSQQYDAAKFNEQQRQFNVGATQDQQRQALDYTYRSANYGQQERQYQRQAEQQAAQDAANAQWRASQIEADKARLAQNQSQFDTYQSYRNDALVGQNERDQRAEISAAMRFGMENNLSESGRRKYQEMMGSLQKVLDARPILGPEKHRIALDKWLAEYNGAMLEGTVVPEETLEQKINKRRMADPAGGWWVSGPNDNIQYVPPPKQEAPLATAQGLDPVSHLFTGPKADANREKLMKEGWSVLTTTDEYTKKVKLPDPKDVADYAQKRLEAEKILYEKLTRPNAITPPSAKDDWSKTPQPYVSSPAASQASQSPPRSAPPLAPQDNLSNNAPSQQAPPPTQYGMADDTPAEVLSEAQWLEQTLTAKGPPANWSKEELARYQKARPFLQRYNMSN